jgi:predicted phosphodiesterase
VLGILAVAGLALTAGCSGSADDTAGGTAFVPSDARGSALVWAVGDGPDGGRNASRVARLIRRSHPDRIVYLGDVYERGTASEFVHNFAPTYGAVAKRIAPTPGNHDWPLHKRGYDPYWTRVRGQKIPAYYAFETAGWQILSLNSEIDHGPDSKQLAWLRSKLRRSGTCRLAFWHRPRYSAGEVHGDQPDVQPFWDALEGHAAIVLAGHEHDMQRFKPRRGITELVSGAGGHGLYRVQDRPELAFANDALYGALRLRLRPGGARFAFVAVGGVTLDVGKIRCKRG